ncbi:MAG: BspA family leucine-rich repeat surface protein [Lachnospiraceae bacterium]|nr:BspA family leucine-rich repeat surface protein [Lachnospiraceae bacterium]
MNNNWKKLMAAFCAASMLMTLPGISVYAVESETPSEAEPSDAITTPTDIVEEPVEDAVLTEVEAPDPEEQEDSAETVDLPDEYSLPTEDNMTEESVGVKQYKVGDGVTATFDPETGSIVLTTTSGGTLWRDWLERAGIARREITSIAVVSTPGSVPSKWKVKLPADASGYKSSEYYLFGFLTNLISFDFRGFDTSNVTDMSYMFYQCSDLQYLNLSGLDTSKVTDMRCVFWGCKSLTNLDLRGLSMSNVTDMGYMFNECGAKTVNLSGIDMSNVTNMSGMFFFCHNLTNLYMSGTKTPKVTKMNDMFYQCKSLTSLDLRGINTSKVTDMSAMFSGCEKLKYLDLGDFDASSIKNAEYMLSGCNALEILITPKNKISKCESYLPNPMYDRNGKVYYQLPVKAESMVLGRTKKLAASIFIDVRDSNHPYYDAIYWAVAKGITKGYPDGTFGINRSCTRGEMVMFLWRYAGKQAPKPVLKSPFKDVPTSHTFYKAILWAYQKGITKGYSDGTFGINKSVSRGESMMFLWRLKGKPEPKPVSVSPFKDVPKNHVFYKAILWGYQKKITTGYTSGAKKGTFGINENCTRGQIVTFLFRARNL